MSNSKPFTCPYCGASFTREKTLAVHMCEKKRRHFQKDEKRVQIGFLTFNRFYKLCQKAKEDNPELTQRQTLSSSDATAITTTTASIATTEDPKNPPSLKRQRTTRPCTSSNGQGNC